MYVIPSLPSRPIQPQLGTSQGAKLTDFTLHLQLSLHETHNLTADSLLQDMNCPAAPTPGID